MTTPDLTPASAALARERTYRLFGRLYLRGPSPSLLPLARALPGLADAVPAEADPDATAAEHHRLFRFNLFPHQSIFLDPAGLLGGAESDRVRQSYRQSGYAVDDDAGPDHVGHELDFLAFLCNAEREALEEGEAVAARRARQRQRHFLQGHLLPWLFPLVLAVRRQGYPFYIALADLTLELVYDHALSLGRESALPEASEDLLPEPPPLLEKSETGLKEIAAYLVTPPYAGLFLTRDAIGRLGHELDVPWGFGDRQQTLVNLLRSAAQYDAFPALIRALQEMAGEWAAAYERRQEQMPELAPFCRPWQARVEETARLLTEIRAKM
ncbi:MAG: molecular chaperone TorD family protein [Candidatus Promineifilaceae bacterium]|nr:molecular chaperone TorD family protein [Candidatus Promineifilaceae bacterium]